jgi:hypothetical protein
MSFWAVYLKCLRGYCVKTFGRRKCLTTVRRKWHSVSETLIYPEDPRPKATSFFSHQMSKIISINYRITAFLFREGMGQSVRWLGHGLDDAGIEFGQGQNIFLFSRNAQTRCGAIQPPIQWVPGFFPGGKAAGAWSWPLTSIHNRG